MIWHPERLDACESTQDEAMQRAHDGAPDGTLVVATRMADGRGRHGNGWHAPEGGLYLSMVLRDLDDPHLLTLALGNAVADTLEVAGADVRLKWVNDVFVDGRKIAGILVEGEAIGDRFDFLVAGIGLNVNGHAADWPHPLNGTATTLEEVLGAESCMEDLEAALLDAVAGWVQKVREGRDDEILHAWRERDLLHGQRVGIDPDGDLCAKVFGTARGVDDRGRLLVEADGRVQAFDNGSVILQD